MQKNQKRSMMDIKLTTNPSLIVPGKNIHKYSPGNSEPSAIEKHKLMVDEPPVQISNDEVEALRQQMKSFLARKHPNSYDDGDMGPGSHGRPGRRSSDGHSHGNHGRNDGGRR